MRVAVVVPAYNVAPYIGQCLQSIIDQEYRDLQIIVVDDGSTDDTAAIVDKYAEQDSRIKVIHQENSGQSVARNNALKLVTAPLITMVDGDDMLLPGTISVWVHALEENPTYDIVLSYYTNNQHSIYKRFEPKPWTRLSGKECLASMLYRKKNFVMTPWGCLMRSHLWKEIVFPAGKIYEDLATMWRIYLKSSGILFTSTPAYFYRQRPNSAMTTFNHARFDVLDISTALVAEMRGGDPRLLAAAQDRVFSAACNILGHLQINGMRNSAEADRCWDLICRGRRQALRDSNSRLRNRIVALISPVLGKNNTARILARFVE